MSAAQPARSPLGALILAAGQGTRMRTGQAKVLAPLCGRPMLAWALEAVQSLRPKAVWVVVGNEAAEVRKKFADEAVAWVVQPRRLGTGHAVLCARRAAGGFRGDLLVACGDEPLVTPEVLAGLRERHRATGAAATILTGRVPDPTGYGRIVRSGVAGGGVEKIVEERHATDSERRIDEINSGTYVFRPPALWSALAAVRPNAATREIYLTDVIGELRRRGEIVSAYAVEDARQVLGVNTQEELAAVSAVLRRRILAAHMAAGVTVLDPDTTYIEAGVAIGPETVIHPFSVLRRGVQVGRGCEVGPFAHLRPGTRLEDGAEVGNFMEVKNTRLGAHSKAKHLSYLGDATIGAGVNIGAGTITANYDGTRKHPTVIEDGASTGSGTVLVAPVRMGKNSKTGAGAIVTRNRNVPPGATVVGVPARVLGRTQSKPAPRPGAGRGR